MPVQFVSSERPYSAQERALERKRRQAQLLRQRADIKTPSGQMVSGHFVAKNPLEHAAELLRGYSAGNAQREFESDQEKLINQQKTDKQELANALRGNDPLNAVGSLEGNELAQDTYSNLRLAQALQPKPEQFEDVLDADGNRIAQQSTTTNKLVDLPKGLQPQETDYSKLLIPGPDGTMIPNQALINAKSQIAEAGSSDINMPTPLTPGREAIDKAFAKDVYVPYTSGGAADMAKNLSQLKQVEAALESGNNLTGPAMGMLPDVVKNFTNPEAVNIREAAEEVVQRNLREVLGAQFTEREGERLIARAYNEKLDESVNAQRISRLVQSIEQAYGDKAKAIAYFEKNGTLGGYVYERPSIDDFNQVVDQMDQEIESAKQDDPLGLR